MRLLICALGHKGYRVVDALCNASQRIEFSCVIGSDDGIIDDYSKKISDLCTKHHIKFNFKSEHPELLLDYDYVIAAGWKWMIKDVSKNKLIIFHDSLLPRYRGFAPVVSAIINREETIGVSVIFGAEEYDCGDIILQKSLTVSYPTRIQEELSRIAELYYELTIELVKCLMDSSLSEFTTPQEEKNATYSLWRGEDDYRIDWYQDANKIEDFINAVGYPYRGAASMLNDGLVRVLGAEVSPDVTIENRSPGKIIFIKNDTPIVVCGRGLLRLYDIRSSDGNSILPLKKFRSKFR